MTILEIFSSKFEVKVISSLSRVALKIRKLSKHIAFVRVCTFSRTLSEKANLKFVINPKFEYSRNKKFKKLHFGTKYHFLGSTWKSNNLKTYV